MAWGSTYLTAKAALVALWDATLPDTVTVMAGPFVGQGLGGVGALTVGAADLVNPEAGTGQIVREGYTDPERVQYLINCVIDVTNGNSDMPAAETQALQIFDLAGAALATGHTLGGLVMFAGLDTFRLFPVQNTDGAVMRLLFAVTVDAFTTV